jgi:MFS family permease
VWGWRGVFIFLGILCPVLISPLAAIFFVQRPEDRGSVPDGFSFRNKAKITDGPVKTPELPSQVIATTLPQAIRTHQFWMVSIAQFITPMGAQLGFYHFGTHLQDVGYTAGQVAHIWGNLMLSAAIATPCFGWISDRLNRYSIEAGASNGKGIMRLFEWSPQVPRLLILTAAYVLSSIGILLLSEISDTGNAFLLWMFITIFGGSYTIRGPMFYAITSDLFEGPQQGKILGATQLFQRLGMGLAPWWGGWMFDVLGSYHQAFYLGIASLMTACLCSWFTGIRTKAQKEMLAVEAI